MLRQDITFDGRAKKFPNPADEFIYHALLPGELRARGKIPF